MSDLKLVWMVGRDLSLQRGIPSEFHTLQFARVSEVSEESPTPVVVVFDPDELSPEDRLQALSQLAAAQPGVPVLVLSSLEERRPVLDLIRANIKGFLLKKESAIRIGEALREICQGGAPFSAGINSFLLELAFNKRTPTQTYNLRDWEIEVLQQLSEGMTKKDISEKYERSVHTIDNHVRMIYAKMNVNNLGAAVGKGLREGIIS